MKSSVSACKNRVTESYPDGAHRKPRTQTNRLASIRGFLNWAVSENYLLESPLDGRAKRIRLPKPDSSMPQCFGLPEIMETTSRRLIWGAYCSESANQKKYGSFLS